MRPHSLRVRPPSLSSGFPRPPQHHSGVDLRGRWRLKYPARVRRRPPQHPSGVDLRDRRRLTSPQESEYVAFSPHSECSNSRGNNPAGPSVPSTDNHSLLVTGRLRPPAW